MSMMATAVADTRSTFSYIWTIENFSELTYIDLKSPTFVLKALGDTVWYLEINEYSGFFCHVRATDFSAEKNDEIDFEFSLLGADGSPLISKRKSQPNRMFIDLMDRTAFVERLSEFIPNNTLTVQYRMWRRDREIPIDACYARTRLETHTGSFIWAIEEFSALSCSPEVDFLKLASDEKKVFPLKPLTKKGPFMALILHVNRTSESDDVVVGFLVEKCRDYAYSCELSVLDANGEVIVSKVQRGRTFFDWAMLTFHPLISKKKLIGNRNLFLPNDTLVLKCSFEVCTGVISNELEFFTPNIFSVTEEAEEVIDFHVAGAEADESLKFEEYFIT